MIVGALSLTRPTGRPGQGPGRPGTVVPLTTGLIGIALGTLVVTTADGGLGTGNGLGGGVVAVILGLIATALGGRALTRSRRLGRTGPTG
ncbi:DUF6223 family protein [Streptomyces sp. NPDC005931]|uniref:DUF6223 family protein n=1 Tax=Streptomyces sp. NPDC005931 TaxID=3364737 RepID=UPI003698DBC4